MSYVFHWFVIALEHLSFFLACYKSDNEGELRIFRHSNYMFDECGGYRLT